MDDAMDAQIDGAITPDQQSYLNSAQEASTPFSKVNDQFPDATYRT